ncbi:hypothetical protein [Aureispira sp. CCB-QB1]|nr:hypothetical protein [Aureispira sp. CCB-QB1]
MKRITVAKKGKGKYVVNVGGKQQGTASKTRAKANAKANKLRKKKGRK